jgi:hypothetical protein
VVITDHHRPWRQRRERLPARRASLAFFAGERRRALLGMVGANADPPFWASARSSA